MRIKEQRRESKDQETPSKREEEEDTKQGREKSE